MDKKIAEISFTIIFSYLLFFNANAQNISLWQGLEKGAYEIGFTTLNLSDNTRQVELNGEQIARPIQIAMWYPAYKGAGYNC